MERTSSKKKKLVLNHIEWDDEHYDLYLSLIRGDKEENTLTTSEKKFLKKLKKVKAEIHNVEENGVSKPYITVQLYGKRCFCLRENEFKQVFDEKHKEFIFSSWKKAYRYFSHHIGNITSDQVKQHFNAFLDIQLNKRPVRKPKTYESITPSRAFTVFACDTFDLSKATRPSFGFVFLDLFSRYTWAFQAPNKEAETVKGFLEEIQRQVPTIRVLISDNGTEFKNDLMYSFCDTHRIKQIFTKPASPWMNGIAERHVGSVKQLISIHITRIGRQEALRRLSVQELVDRGWNNIPNAITKEKPEDILRKRQNIQFIHAIQTRIMEHKDKLMRKRYLEKNPYEVGQKVRLALFSPLIKESFTRKVYIIKEAQKKDNYRYYYRVAEEGEEQLLKDVFYREHLLPIDQVRDLFNETENERVEQTEREEEEASVSGDESLEAVLNEIQNGRILRSSGVDTLEQLEQLREELPRAQGSQLRDNFIRQQRRLSRRGN